MIWITFSILSSLRDKEHILLKYRQKMQHVKHQNLQIQNVLIILFSKFYIKWNLFYFLTFQQLLRWLEVISGAFIWGNRCYLHMIAPDSHNDRTNRLKIQILVQNIWHPFFSVLKILYSQNPPTPSEIISTTYMEAAPLSQSEWIRQTIFFNLPQKQYLLEVGSTR